MGGGLVEGVVWRGNWVEGGGEFTLSLFHYTELRRGSCEGFTNDFGVGVGVIRTVSRLINYGEVRDPVTGKYSSPLLYIYLIFCCCFFTIL